MTVKKTPCSKQQGVGWPTPIIIMMMMHLFLRRSQLRTEFVSNAKSLDSMYFRRFLSTSQENTEEVVRKGTVNPLLIPIVGSERASWKETLKKVFIYLLFDLFPFDYNRCTMQSFGITSRCIPFKTQ